MSLLDPPDLFDQSGLLVRQENKFRIAAWRSAGASRRGWRLRDLTHDI